MPKAPFIEPNAGQHKILKSLLFYHYLTIPQVQRLHFNSGNYTYVSTLLKQLVDSNYLQNPPLYLPRNSRYGKPMNVYTLSTHGYNYLAESGISIEVRYRPSEEKRKTGGQHLQHTLEVNDFFISAELLARNHDYVRIRRRLHERDLKSMLRSKEKRVHITDAARDLLVPVIPDGFLELAVRLSNGKARIYPIVLELDRDSEEASQFRRKVNGLLAWYRGAYQQLFETSSMNIAIVNTGKPEHTNELLRWVEDALVTLNARDDSGKFLCTHSSLTQTVPHDLFFSPLWHTPFYPESIPLLVIS